MIDLGDQLRTYFDTVDPPFEPEHLMREILGRPDAARVMPRRGFAFALATALLVVLLIGLPLLILGEGTDPITEQPTIPAVPTTTAPDTTTVPTTTVPTTTVPTTTATVDTTSPPTTETPASPPQASAEWTRPDQDEGFFLGGFAGFDVMATASGFFAVGDAGPPGKKLVWASPDGISWTVAAELSGEELLTSVVGFGDLLVAGGAVCSDGTPFREFPEPPSPCVSGPVIWTSADGVIWEQVPYDEDVFGRGGAVNDLATYGARIMAIGMTCSGTDLSGCAPAVWESTDGRGWTLAWKGPTTQVACLDDCSVNPIPWLRSAFEAPDGTAGIVGTWCEGDATTCSGAVWLRDDETGSWTRIPDSGGAFEPGTLIHDAINGPGGLVAVGGADMGARVAIWVSHDSGSTWSRVADPGNSWYGANLTSIVHDGTEYVAVGSGWEIFWRGIKGPGQMVVFTSHDGVTWTKLALPDRGYLHSVAASPSRLVAIGRSNSPGQPMGLAIWTQSRD